MGAKLKRRCPSCHFDWLELPSVTIGGGSGDYFIDCPISSHDEVQFRVTALSNFDASALASAVVSGTAAPGTPPTSSQTTVNGASALQGIVYGIPPSAHATITPTYEHMQNPQRRVFIRIDTSGSGQVYVSIQFRLHAHMKGAPHAVHIVNDPEHEDLINQQRESQIMDKLGYIKHPERIPI